MSFSRIIFLIRLPQSTYHETQRNLSMKSFDKLHPIIGRQLAWFSSQAGKQPFGKQQGYLY